jgi:8-oxo-dGTP pyrophosphatase MutT (NUDIX family)
MKIKGNEIIKSLEAALNARPFNVIRNDGGYRESAVLIPLFFEQNDLKILFTERAFDLPHHRGQISFPGGKVDERDSSLIETVLRETREEIGIKPENIKIIGRMDSEITLVSNFIIHPFVGQLIDISELRLNQREVQSVLTAPFEFFLYDNGNCYNIEYENGQLNTRAYKYQGKFIWGATYRILTKFVEFFKSDVINRIGV